MIVVDMQNDFVAKGAPMETPAARAMVPRLTEALKTCRGHGIKVIYTAHVHRRDGCDMGLFNMHPPIANRAALVDDTPASTSTRNSHRNRVSTSSRSIATAGSSAPTLTSSCASGASTR
jgi:nicotinamidase-related amidase